MVILSFIRSGRKHFARHSERGKKTRQTEEEVGRQHQGMDRPGVRQVPDGRGEQGKMVKTGCKIICGAPTTLAVNGLMMMMMMMSRFRTDVLYQVVPRYFGTIVRSRLLSKSTTTCQRQTLKRSRSPVIHGDHDHLPFMAITITCHSRHDHLPFTAITITCHSRQSRSPAIHGNHDHLPFMAITVTCHSWRS